MDNMLALRSVKLWTRQHENVLEEINRSGVYRVKKEFLINKFDTISDYYLNIYSWYIERAEKLVPRPQGAEFPIWLSVSSELMLQPTQNNVILELLVDRDNIVFTDSEKWGYVSNYWYLPLDKEDERKHNEELKKLGIGDESELYMGHKGNFYPHLKSKTIRSWERLFEKNQQIAPNTQATIWEIKKEWIADVTYFNDKTE